MAITKLEKITESGGIDEHTTTLFRCPICKATKSLKIPKSIVNQAKQLTTMSISSGLICEHHFQAFVDKNFKVRGYQKVDFEFKDKNAKKNQSKVISPKNRDKGLFNNIVIEGNYLEYNPKETKKNTTYNHKHLENLLKLRNQERNYSENTSTKPLIEKKKYKRSIGVVPKLNNKDDAQKDVFKSADNVVKNIASQNKEMTLKEIYEEFWEFIEDDNDEFQEFIIKDKRRKKLYPNQLF